MKRELLSIGQNRKLGKDVAVFNLPRSITCPGKTPVCSRVCYADKAQRMYKRAAAKRRANYAASKLPDFVKKITAELLAPLRKKRLHGPFVGHSQTTYITYQRWHESGDVYSQGYLNKIFRVCRNTPRVVHLMYTKSFHLDWSKKPDNLKVYWSVDNSTTAPVPKGPTAYLLLKGEALPLNAGPAVTCRHAAPANYCGTQCRFCWDGKVRVYFPKH